MKKVLIGISALAVGVLLLPETASAQRRGFGGGTGRYYGGGAAFRGPAIAVRPGFAGYGYRAARYRPALGVYGRGIGYPGRRWAYGGGYRPYFGGGYRRSYGYDGAVAAGLIGGLALGSLGFFAAPYDPGYSYPSYGYPSYGGVAYEAYAPGLTQRCFPSPGCRADGYPDARYYRRGYDGY